MGNIITFELTQNTFSELISVLENYTTTLDDYTEISKMVSLIESLCEQKDKDIAEQNKCLYEEIDDQRFHEYLKKYVENEECKKNIDELYKEFQINK